MRGLTHVKLAFRAPRCAQASVKLLLLLAQCTLQKAAKCTRYSSRLLQRWKKSESE